MSEAFYCEDCLKAAYLRRKPKKHIESVVGNCAGCDHRGRLYLKSDYSYHGKRAAPVIVLPPEKQPRQVREWPEHLRFD
jgi:hypothetical protein